jgi:hypothetical protein
MLLGPTGAGATDASGRRQQQQHARIAAVANELRAQLLDAVQIDELLRARGRRNVLAAAGRRDEREDRDTRGDDRACAQAETVSRSISGAYIPVRAAPFIFARW